MKRKSITALLLASLLALSPLAALAEEYDIGEGSITVSHNGTAQTVSQNGSDHTEESATVVKGSSTSNTLTVNAPEGTKVEVTLKDVNIDVSEHEAAAVTTTGQGDVTVELDGNNKLKSGDDHAGLQKENSGNLTIRDSNDTGGSLTATGGDSGAGIGGGDYQSGSNITISDATVTASGGHSGAGIGGGYGQSGSNITISDATVIANGGHAAAGIGGGINGNGDNITIAGSTVTANGGGFGAGIGGGANWSDNNAQGDGTNITITESTVTATGGYSAAGIGGGVDGDASNIVISSSTVIAAGGDLGAGIGNGSEIPELSVTGIRISGDSNVSAAGGTTTMSNYPEGAAIGHGGHLRTDAPVEVEPDIDQLCSNGSVSYYAAGTSVEAMQNGTAEPVKTDTGEKHIMTFVQGTEATCDTDGVLDHYHCSQCNKNYKDEAGKQVLSSVVIPKGHTPDAPVKENEVQPTETKAGSYDEVVYCKVCGAEISRKTKTVPALEDAFTRFCKQVARQIRQAPEDGTVHVNGTVWSGLQRRVFEALHERPDVTVVITCKLDGKDTELTIPAGADLLLSAGQAAVISYAEMDKLLG